MVLEHGLRQLATNCANMQPLSATRRFYSAFYRLSRAGCCSSKRNISRSFYTTSNSPESPDATEPVSISNIKATPKWKPPPKILSQDIRHIMRSLPHSVVVLTTSTREKNETIDQMIKKMLNKRKPSRSLQNLKSEVDVPESSSAVSTVAPRQIPRERLGIRGFNNNGRLNYYSVPTEEWIENLETPIRNLEQNSHKDYRGMTLSSFATVCLSDPPMISFNVRSPSRTLDALRKASGKFMIHILEANSAGAKIASAFSTGGGGTEGFDKLQVKEYHDYTGKTTRNTIALPVIKSPGVKRVLYCQIDNGISRSFNRKNPHYFDVIPVGDHHIVFAKVFCVLEEPRTGVVEVEGSEEEKWHGLSYADGQYRDFGDVIDFDPGKKTERVKMEESRLKEPNLEERNMEER